MLAQHLADRRGIAGEDVEHALGHAGLFGERDQRQRGQRRFIGGLEHHVQPAASAGETLRVIIEQGKFHGVMAPQTPIGCLIASSRIRPLGRDGFAIDAAGFLGEKFDIGAADIDLAERFGQRLALL